MKNYGVEQEMYADSSYYYKPRTNDEVKFMVNKQMHAEKDIFSFFPFYEQPAMVVIERRKLDCKWWNILRNIRQHIIIKIFFAALKVLN